uniref:molybdopterin-dependent oxidoreductase n=1 Tax=uncultured Demequina sp. TaxID=693499 RepID=UPI0025DFD8DE
GAVGAGALPGLLPGGRAMPAASARQTAAEAWGVDALPEQPGRDAAGIITAAAAGKLSGLVVGGVTPSDLTADLRKALDRTGFVLSLEVRRTEVSEYADVVLPVAPPSEKPGTFVNWEGRLRGFATAIRTDAISDHRAIDFLARELGVDLKVGTVADVNEQLAALGAAGKGERVKAPTDKPAKAPAASGDQLVLASWHLLVDEGALQDGEPYLAGTGRTAVARVSQATAESIGIEDGVVTITGEARGAIELPVVVTEMADGVVWLPAKSPGSWVAQELGVEPGSLVTVKGGI